MTSVMIIRPDYQQSLSNIFFGFWPHIMNHKQKFLGSFTSQHLEDIIASFSPEAVGT